MTVVNLTSSTLQVLSTCTTYAKEEEKTSSVAFGVPANTSLSFLPLHLQQPAGGG